MASILDLSKPVWRVIGYVTDPNLPGLQRTICFVNGENSSEAVAAARAGGMDGVSQASLVSPQPVKKYRIINLATNAEWETDTFEEVWDIIGKEIPLYGIYEVRDNLTNEIVPEFIPL